MGYGGTRGLTIIGTVSNAKVIIALKNNEQWTPNRTIKRLIANMSP
jgi:hypothetical protein